VDIQYLGLDDWLVIASAVLGIEPGVLAKASRLVVADSALNAPAAAFGGEEFYPEFATKAGLLGYRLARHHALPDGNKRTAFLAMVEFVERNGRQWEMPDETRAVEMMIGAAAGTVSERDFIDWAAGNIA
jgi:death-on-curing protein